MREDRWVVRRGRFPTAEPSHIDKDEWLVTNGIGGFASGTVCGILTRRYHGLLVAALAPPGERTLLFSKLDETVLLRGAEYPIFANRWASGDVSPSGFVHMESFHLEGTTPVWTFRVADALIEKRLWMPQGQNKTVVLYRLLDSACRVGFDLKLMVNYRNFHATTLPGSWDMDIETQDDTIRLQAFPGATSSLARASSGVFEVAPEWFLGYHLDRERERGLDCTEAHLHAATLRTELSQREPLTLVLAADPDPEPQDGWAAYQEHRREEKRSLSRSGLECEPLEIRQLVLAASQFGIRRPHTSGEISSVIAGYPWFGEWSRDTLIALPGLTLALGRPKAAAEILKGLAEHLAEGMVPNFLPEPGQQTQYNTVDGALWYIEACRLYEQETGDNSLAEQLFPTFEEIIRYYREGTQYRIHQDSDGLLYAGEPGVQLTWMDAKVGDWVVTPRTGKPVEINALWYNGLRSMEVWSKRMGQEGSYRVWAQEVREAFQQFWNPERDCCFDVLDTPEGSDPRIRPNQIFAVSLEYSALSEAQKRAVVTTCLEHLHTSHGLRSLSPAESEYVGQYRGGPFGRDASYHQGTVWGWLIGPFVRAHLKVFGDSELARTYLRPMLQQVHTFGLGSIGEIFDGDPPHRPRGAIAQAWSVAEVLWTWRKVGGASEVPP